MQVEEVVKNLSVRVSNKSESISIPLVYPSISSLREDKGGGDKKGRGYGITIGIPYK